MFWIQMLFCIQLIVQFPGAFESKTMMYLTQFWQLHIKAIAEALMTLNVKLDVEK